MSAEEGFGVDELPSAEGQPLTDRAARRRPGFARASGG
jgi:hypothetical protein